MKYWEDIYLLRRHGLCGRNSTFTFQGESEGGMTEIRFVPDDASSLDSMFTAMSECQVHIGHVVIC